LNRLIKPRIGLIERAIASVERSADSVLAVNNGDVATAGLIVLTRENEDFLDDPADPTCSAG
jgi:hypothetical protein